MMGGFDGMMGGWGGYGLAGGLLTALLLVGLLSLVAWIVVRVSSSQPPASAYHANRTDAAEEIIRERFARGEIDVEEYARSLRALRGDPAHGA